MNKKNLFLVSIFLIFSSSFLGCDLFEILFGTDPSTNNQTEVVSTETPNQSEVSKPNDKKDEDNGVISTATETPTPSEPSVVPEPTPTPSEPDVVPEPTPTPSEPDPPAEKPNKVVYFDVYPKDQYKPYKPGVDGFDPFPIDWRRSIFESIPKNFEATYYPDLDLQIIDEINNYREKNGLNRLEVSQDLMYTSRYKSLSQAERSYIDHPNPEFGGKKAGYLIWDVFKHDSDGYAENLIKSSCSFETGPLSAHHYFELWEDSPGHNSNMLIDFGKKIGVSVVSVIDPSISGSEYYSIYVTMHITD